jgi:hypothetical protein
LKVKKGGVPPFFMAMTLREMAGQNRKSKRPKRMTDFQNKKLKAKMR